MPLVTMVVASLSYCGKQGCLLPDIATLNLLWVCFSSSTMIAVLSKSVCVLLCVGAGAL